METFCIKDDGNWITVVHGEPGSGKSALLAKYSEQTGKRHPDWLVIPHFVGASPDSANLRQLLQSFYLHINKASNSDENIPADFKALVEGFSDKLKNAANPDRVIFIIDAVNQIEKSDNAHNMPWLPRIIPKNTRFIISTLSGKAHDATSKITSLQQHGRGTAANSPAKIYPKTEGFRFPETRPAGSGNGIWKSY